MYDVEALGKKLDLEKWNYDFIYRNNCGFTFLSASQSKLKNYKKGLVTRDLEKWPWLISVKTTDTPILFKRIFRELYLVSKTGFK